MQENEIPYERQIFVCTNDRHGERASCGDNKGEEIFKELRRIARDNGLHPRIRVAQAKCLGQCENGVNIMIYPDGIWLCHVRLSDIQQIAERYLGCTP